MTFCLALIYENSRQGISLNQYPKLIQEIVHNLTQQISRSPLLPRLSFLFIYFLLLNIPLQGTITYNQYDWKIT